MVLYHSYSNCYFSRYPYLFTKEFLRSEKFLKLYPSLPFCECYQFAICHNDPTYVNTSLNLDEFKDFLDVSESWRFLYKTNYRYNLPTGLVRDHRDPFIKKALKEYDLPFYYECCDKNKTPRSGRMFFSLLQYCYPRHKMPRNAEHLFWAELNKAEKFVLSQFDPVKPIHWLDAMERMPKNTSAGFNGLQYSGTTERKIKGDILPFIKRRYLQNYLNIINQKEVNDYCMFAMRGHLSDRLKTKTRPVWLVSASTIVSELRYYSPFYDQINTKEFFRSRWITGRESLPRLNRYLRRHPEKTFINTDISGWDSFRAAWFHRRILYRLKELMNLTPEEELEYDYCVESAIHTKVLLPDGSVYRKLAGIISGTAGTLLVNSLLNTIAGYCVLSMMKVYSLEGQFDFVNKIFDPNWLGDDFSFFTDFSFDIEKFGKLMFKYFNVQINTDKTIITKDPEERKYLGYSLKGGFLFREEKEFFQALLYTERPWRDNPFSISFSRFFSYLLLGGINNYRIVEFFYYYCGKYDYEIVSSNVLFDRGLDNIFKLLKDVWNVKIPTFNIDTFRNMNLIMMKYCLLYGYDLRFDDLTY